VARSAVCLIAVAAALGLPACGSSEDEPSTPSKASQPAETATPTATERSKGGYGY
jgi:hypothetical protein